MLGMAEALGSGDSVPANELRQVKQLLWHLISEKLNPVEVDEVNACTRTRRALVPRPLVRVFVATRIVLKWFLPNVCLPPSD